MVLPVTEQGIRDRHLMVSAQIRLVMQEKEKVQDMLLHARLSRDARLLRVLEENQLQIRTWQSFIVEITRKRE